MFFERKGYAQSLRHHAGLQLRAISGRNRRFRPAQNYADWELILWDDGSTDKTPEICRKLAEEDSRIRFFRSEKNRGVSLSRLSAVKHAEGRFLAFLDGDDVWSKDKLSTQVIFMLKNKYPISHTEYAFINAEGKLLPRGHLKVDREVDLKKLMKTTQLGVNRNGRPTANRQNRALSRKKNPFRRYGCMDVTDAPRF